MQSKAFTLVEFAITIFLAGVMGTLGYFYLSTSSLQTYQYATTLQSHITLIESMVFQCKNLSEQFPQEANTSLNAADTLLSDLECNTTVPYSFDGGKNGFVPIPPNGFTSYRATETGDIFYISTTAENNSTQDEALQKLVMNYTSTQASLEHNDTSAIFKFYLSR